MQHLAIIGIMFALAGCAQSAQLRDSEVVRPILEEPASLEQIDAEALRAAKASPTSVTRDFELTWEYHHGYFLVKDGNYDDLVKPIFDKDEIMWQFQIFEPIAPVYRKGQEPPPTNKRPYCKCVGVEYSLGASKYFLVRSATLERR